MQGHPGTFIGKSGHVWSIEPPAPRRRAPQNIIRQRPGTKPNSRKETIAETFSLFLTPAIQQKIIKDTNEEGALVYASWNEKHTEERHKEFKELDLVELNALNGVLILRSVFAGRNENIYNIWTKSQFSDFYSMHGKR